MKYNRTKKLSARLAVKTPEVLQSLTDIVSSLDNITLLDDPKATRVDVLVLEIGSDPDSELETIRTLLQEGVVGTLFVTSAEATSKILLPALHTGAKEFFQQPILPQEVVKAFMEVRVSDNGQESEEMPSKEGSIFSVLGAKGGVGTTTFAVNLATSIQSFDKSKLVALIDMNRMVGEVPLFLNLETDLNWEEIGKNINRLDAAYLKSAMTRHSSGVYVMPAPNKIANGVQLARDYLVTILTAMQDFFDYIVIDSGMYLDDISFKIFEKSEVVYLISTLSLPCIINAKRLKESLDMGGEMTNGKVQIIANRFEKKSQISLKEAGKMIGGEISVTIPNDYELTMSAINNGKPIANVRGKSNLARVYSALAETIVGKNNTKGKHWWNAK
ncbi:AAA family ATPase [Desulfotalea psychrophila]|uniref:Related to septum site-determining protein (MinD) n=1 Tax=Desulfotalea psychrophila (strain LSv54 / DSM 12343) TaxID=177439 RepID=Q6AN14_DESPS|nr:AAA family ATPase [Desulfotalea psychrophila]CAG36260.1 related to septum site-determining protein (MinD) [Desulfotalea psychrophila LSv54]